MLRPSVPAVKTSGILEAADVEVAFLRRKGNRLGRDQGIEPPRCRRATGRLSTKRMVGRIEATRAGGHGDVDGAVGAYAAAVVTDKDGHFWQQNPAKTSKWAKLARRP